MDGDVQGVPAGVTGTPIQGVPPGVTGAPIQGVPAGVTGTAIQGVPSGVTGTPIGTAAPPDNTGILPALGDAVQSYIQGVKQRMGSTPAEFGHNVVARLSNLGSGMEQNVARSMLTIEKLTRDIDQAHGIYTHGHPLDNEIARSQQVVDFLAGQKPAAEPEAAANIKLGDDATNVLQYMSGEGAIKALPFADMLSELAPVQKVLKQAPNAAKVLRTMIEQGMTGGAQATAQGAAPEDIATSALTAAGLGGIAELPGARVASRAATAAELTPIEKESAGVPYTVLPSEIAGPQGQTTATPLQQEAATIGETKAIRAQRQAGFPQLQTNLAKTATENALNASNAASLSDLKQRLVNTDDPQLEQQLQQQINDVQKGGTGAPAWSYISPEGNRLSPGEARATLQGIREHWMSQDFSPAEDEQIQTRYNDLKDQLDRYDNLAGNQPVSPMYNVPDAVNNTTNFADAANHLRIVGDRALAEMPQSFRERYQNLADTRAKLQDDFDSNAGVPRLQTPIEREMDRVNDRMNDILNDPQVADRISAPRANQALTDKRLSDAFTAIHNTMTKHTSVPADVAAKLGIPSEPAGLGSLAQDIEAIKAKYGDVLNPVMGAGGLDHITDMGKYMDMPAGKERVDSLLGNMAMILRRHYMGMRALAMYPATAGVGYLAHMAGHLAGVSALSVGALAGEAQAARTRFKLATDPVYNRMIRDRISADPAFANRFLFGAKNVPVTHAAPLLASSMLNWINSPSQSTAPPAGATNATGQ
jgi:hypothetical protein